MWYNGNSKETLGENEYSVVADGAKTAIVIPCRGATMVEHIVHIDGVTGSSPVATTGEPNRKVRLVMYSEKNEHREPSLCVLKYGVIRWL